MNSDKAYRKNAVRLFCGLILLGGDSYCFYEMRKILTVEILFLFKKHRLRF